MNMLYCEMLFILEKQEKRSNTLMIIFINKSASYVQQWGGGDKIATVIAVFFCEIVMVISAFGAITYMKQEKTVISQRMLYWNIALALLGASSGIYLFLSQ